MARTAHGDLARAGMTRDRALTGLRLAIAAGLAVGAAGLIAGCGESPASNTAADIVAASVRTFEITTLATGELEARNQMELRNLLERQGTITFIVPEGTLVRKGEVVVRLNSEEIEKEMQEAELQLNQAQLDLDSATSERDIQISDNLANLRKAELKVDLAELALEQWEKGDHAIKMKELEVKIEKNKRDLDRLKEKKEKSDTLYQQEFLSYDEWKRDEIALLEGEANYETALLEEKTYTEYQLRRDQAEKLNALEEAKQELDRVVQTNQISLRGKESALENRKIRLGRHQQSLEELTRELNNCTITAPRDGLVVYATSLESQSWRRDSEGPMAVGRQVYTNDLIGILPDVSEMVATVKVHESLAGRVRPGQRAEVKIEAAGGVTAYGTVESIGVLAETGGRFDPSRREYSVRIALDQGQVTQGLKPSMRCEAKLILGEVTDTLSVPVQAVFSDGPVRYVYVQRGGRVERKPVAIGRRSELFAEITAGIVDGETVMVRNPSAGEIDDGPWDQGELIAAGYTLDENGNPVAPRGQGGVPGGVPGGGRRPGGFPGAKAADRATPGVASEAQTPQAPALTAADDTAGTPAGPSSADTAISDPAVTDPAVTDPAAVNPAAQATTPAADLPADTHQRR